MASNYHFCFSFSRIILDGPTMARVGCSSAFKMALLLEKQLVGTTAEVLCAPTPSGEIAVESQLVLFESEGGAECEIRLVEVGEAGEERAVGGYEFQLGNYLRAHRELNRSCIELNVQIAAGFILSYEVYLERTLEALHKVMYEHEAARKLADSNCSDHDSFLPDEVANEHMQAELREGQLDRSPLLLNQRFWSPRRRRPRKTRASSKVTSSNSIDSSPEDKRLTFMRVKKTESSQVELRPSLIRTHTLISSSELFEQNIDNEEEINQQNYVQLYQVIRTDSKITLPLPQQQSRTDRPLSPGRGVKESQKRSPPIKSNAKQYIFVFLAALLFCLAASFLFLRNQQSSRKMRLQKERRRSSKNH